MAALARFPHTPTVYFCHGWLPWRRRRCATRHPSLRRVSGATRERLCRARVPPGRVRTIPNSWTRGDLRHGIRCRRALDAPSSSAIRRRRPAGSRRCGRRVARRRGGCRRLAFRRLPHRPEDAGRMISCSRAGGRVEAMAVGCAVVLCDTEGLGPWSRPRHRPPGRRQLRHPGAARCPSCRAVRASHRRLRRGERRPDSRLVRATWALDVVVPRVFAVYQRPWPTTRRAARRRQAHAAPALRHLAAPGVSLPWLAPARSLCAHLIDAEAVARTADAASGRADRPDGRTPVGARRCRRHRQPSTR